MDPVSAPRDVEIRDESIRLGQFLKLADLIDNGAEAKPLMMQGLV
ncbi:MAG TPA: RNA-binding S4 domain-containing protein, partial [Nocardioidaceae bacterium]|nr:RNA-binding S4 domain-containing protein [Nocardioidaceae bacterium]